MYLKRCTTAAGRGAGTVAERRKEEDIVVVSLH